MEEASVPSDGSSQPLYSGSHSEQRIVLDVQDALSKARQCIKRGDSAGADALLQPISHFMTMQDNGAAMVDAPSNQLRDLWLATLRALLPLFERQARIKRLWLMPVSCRADPAHTVICAG
ncbi:MAG: hypothetical protein R2932_17235 [Caldilineaceae bacterium]